MDLEVRDKSALIDELRRKQATLQEELHAMHLRKMQLL
jgi:hypothetical protein